MIKSIRPHSGTYSHLTFITISTRISHEGFQTDLIHFKYILLLNNTEIKLYIYSFRDEVVDYGGLVYRLEVGYV